MKILTLNTHSIEEENYSQKLEWFLEWILKERPDIVAMQEVNQTAGAASLEAEKMEGNWPTAANIPVTLDNHAAAIAHRLNQAGIPCWWAWLPIKRGYGKYDEGVALLSLGRPIVNGEFFPISGNQDYFDWHIRAALGIQVQGLPDWFYSVHLGWWSETGEDFQDQWQRLRERVSPKKTQGPVWLLGDFNAPDTIRGESYDAVADGGWLDTHKLARDKDRGITVPGAIDGWRDGQAQGLRLDYIWCSQKVGVRSSRVVFNGTREPQVSDHFGVLVCLE